MTFLARGSGVLLHLSSLPGDFGIGDIGPTARAFIDQLAAAGQRYWQFLPLVPTSPGLDNSPYMGLSAFAGNPLLISPEQLVADNLLSADWLRPPGFSEHQVDYAGVLAWKRQLLEAAIRNLGAAPWQAEYRRFVAAEADWLADYALFMALHEENQGAAWYDWPSKLARRQPAALAAARRRLAAGIDFHQGCQFIFFRQWEQLRQYAAGQGVSLIGDMPIYVAPDSAEVWARPEIFILDEQTLQPTLVAGVPPDYFSATGQRWGNPLFRWDGDKRTRARLERWWERRLRLQLRLADIVRIDHFRGFEACWQIPAAEPDAVNGQWVKGPGERFFRQMEKALGSSLPIIAEDLGLITPEVEELRDQLGLPGMKVLQFAFDSDETNVYLPHNYPHRNCVVYTGTHDNDTTMGWFLSEKCTPEAQRRLLRYLGWEREGAVHWGLIRLALASVAALAIIPLQDVLGFGADCRLNTPGTSQGNWRWRLAPGFLSAEAMAQLREETEFYNRLPGQQK
ncbi:MAG: 4-alpha-glucanotransferase [Desulfurivibrio sp.]|nr:4-alpha-glucanotransferase [Desulfurivibrio sp.]